MESFIFICSFVLTLCYLLDGVVDAATESSEMGTVYRLSDSRDIFSNTIDSTLVFYESSQPRDSAETECKRIGGRLMTVSSQLRLQMIEDWTTSPLWIGGRRKSTSEEFKWDSGEFLEPSVLPFIYNTDYARNCIYYNYESDTGYRFYNDHECTGVSKQYVCELDMARPDHHVSGITQKILSVTFMIVKDQNVNHSIASEDCQSEYMSGKAGGRLANPTTNREMREIDNLILEAEGGTRWWIGATREHFGEVPKWSNNDKIPLSSEWQFEKDNGGLCMIYNSRDKKFGWEFCKTGENEKTIDGFICQDDVDD